MAGLVVTLRAAGCVFAEDEAALLVEAAAGDAAALAAMTARRVAGEPLEQIVGWAEFDGLRLAVEPGVFVPRTRTTLLVDEAAALLSHRAVGQRAIVVDLCCGVGAIAAALLQRAALLDVHAADIDEAAVRAARRNLPGESVYLGDLFDALPGALRGRVDVIACNAPYVPTDAIALMPPEAREHEARVTLDGGADGLDVHRRVAAAAPQWLVPGGALLVEASEGQAPATAAIFAAAGLTSRIARDDERDATVVVGVR